MLSQISMRTGFLYYVTSQTINKLTYIDDELVELYKSDPSLAALNGNSQKWNSIRSHAYKNVDLDEPAPTTTPQIHLYTFVEQLVLMDKYKKIVAGELRPEADYHYHEVIYKNQVIALIAYTKPSDFVHSIDHQFFKEQVRSLALISIAVAIVSLLIVLVLSRSLTRPLTALSKSAQRLAAGEFSVRINHESADELGLLCRNFNEMANTLAANEQARKQWVADISHEMRTPLAVVKAQIEAMQDGIRETNDENLSLLKNKIDSLNHLINDLYELSLSDLGALSYTKEPLDIAELAAQVVEDFSYRAKEKNLTLHLNNNMSKPALIFGDANRLTQMLTNLLENSLRYTDAPGRVQVEIKRDKQVIELFVLDSAPAVPNDKLNKVFERLVRLESSRNRVTGGAGLGLSISKNIVEAHNGSISAHPSPLGGLQIKVELPVHAE